MGVQESKPHTISEETIEESPEPVIRRLDSLKLAFPSSPPLTENSGETLLPNQKNLIIEEIDQQPIQPIKQIKPEIISSMENQDESKDGINQSEIKIDTPQIDFKGDVTPEQNEIKTITVHESVVKEYPNGDQ